MRIALIGVVSLIVLLLAAVLVGPSFVDWNSQKALIQAEARKATGRELAIGGDVNLSLLPSPTLSASGVRLANVEGGSAPAMIELDALQVEVALLPLLQGTLKVESVALIEPRILLEILPDGRRNWNLDAPAAESAPRPEAPTEPAPTASATTGQSDPAPSEPAVGDESGSDFTVQVDSFAIERGVVIYRDAVSGTEERIEDLDGRIVAESLDGPFAVTGEGRLRGLETAVQVTVGRLQRDGATPVNAEVSLPRQDAKLGFSGSLSMNPNPVGLRGKVRGSGENLGAVVAALTGMPANDLPPALANSFTIAAELAGDEEAVTLGETEMLLGDTSVNSTARVTFGPPVSGQLKISVPKLDLDSLLAAAQPVAAEQEAEDVAAEPETSGDTAEEPQAATPDPGAGSAGAPGTEKSAPLTIPADVMGDLQIAIDTLVYNKRIASQVRVNASMEDGRISLNQALALLPGGSDLSLTGTLSNGSAGPRFDGRIEAAADNLRGVLSWLGADVDEIPADRLRKMSFSGKLQGSRQQVSLTEVDLRVDVSRLAGGVVVALRDRPGLGIGLSIDSLNVDAYLPRPGAAAPSDKANAKASENLGGSGAEAASGESGGATEAAPEAPAAPAVRSAGGLLDAIDANLNLRIASLTYQDQAVKDLAIEGTLQKGLLTLRKAQVGDIAGSSLGYSGTLQDLDGDLLADGMLELRVADPQRLARLAGMDSDALERLGAFNLTTNLRGTAKKFGFNAKLAALGGRYAVAGIAEPLRATPTFDLDIQAEHPDLAGLTRALTGEAAVPDGFGGLKVQGKVTGNPSALRISALDGLVGPLAVKGTLALDGTTLRPSGLNLDLAVKHGNVAQLARGLGGPASLSDDMGPIDVKGRLTSTGQTVAIEDLTGSIGPLALSGRASADLSGAEPALTALDANVRLRHPSMARLARMLGGPAMRDDLGAVDLQVTVSGTGDRWEARDLKGVLGPTKLDGTVSADLSGARPRIALNLGTGPVPVSRMLAAAGAPTGSGGAGGTGSGQLSPRWSHDPIDLSGLRTVDLDIRTGSQALVFDAFRLDQATLVGTLVDGQFTLEKLTGQAFQGAVQISGKADARDALAASFAVTAIEVQLGQLLKQQADLDRVSGPVTVNASLTARGASEAELVSSLTGKGDLAGTVTVRAKAEEALGAALLGVLGEQVSEIRGVANATSSIFGAFAGAPSALSGTFSIDRGVVRTADTRLRGRSATALTQGTADLPAWLLNARTEVFRDGDGDTPYLTATASGQLDEPSVKVGGQLFQRQQGTTGAAGGAAGGSTTGPAPSPRPGNIDPKDLLEGLLKKLGE